MYIDHNLTNAEAFRIYGTLPADRIEQLIDRTESVNADTLEGVASDIEEARGCFPDEDFMGALIESLWGLEGNLRGANKETIKRIIEQAEQLNTEICQSAECGREKLTDAERGLPSE